MYGNSPCLFFRFGAGSEFGRDAREEARRKKFGITARRYKPDDQPWILKVGGKTGKKWDPFSLDFIITFIAMTFLKK